MISVIVPYVREWPQIAFTLRSIHYALNGIPHEVIAIDNLMPNMAEDRGTPNIKGMANKWANSADPWLKYYHYTDKLSHWQCKNFGVHKAEGDFLWFVDAHCIMPRSAATAAIYYRDNWKELNGSLHMPLTYHILEPQRLIYKAVVDVNKGDYAYSFVNYNPEAHEEEAVEVPAMSTCGMLIHRQYLDLLGYWPVELGIYSGGEYFMNYTMAVLGLKKWIWNCHDPLCHHGDKRGYNWNHYDQQRNRAIATYIFGGESLLHTWMKNVAKLNGREKEAMTKDVTTTCHRHRSIIEKRTRKTLIDFVFDWAESPLMVGNY